MIGPGTGGILSTAMSRENVEIVRRLYQAFNQADYDSMLAPVHPDVEFDASDRLPDEGILRGRDAYRRFLERTFDTWAQFAVEVDELVDAGDAVVALVRIVGVGKTSKVTVEERTVHVTWLRDGTPYRVKVFADRGDALRAVGRRE
jgi:ketosteroid isomerase-like protein